MAEKVLEEAQAIDSKAAKKAEKARQKEEKKLKKKDKKAKGAGTGTDEDEPEGSKLAVILVTIVIIAVWLGILGLLVKWDVGGFGSTVLYPVLKDVPYINKILPEVTPQEGDAVVDVQYPYTTVEDAIARIKELEVELSNAQEAKNTDDETVTQLQNEVSRLQEFETGQADFQSLKTKFYQDVVFSDNAPDIEEYKKYYESIDAANAAELYKQVVKKEAFSQEVLDYASTYASMKPKQAAAIMEQMTDNLKLVASILESMDVESRGGILGAMDPKVAAQVTKLMEPKEP